LSLLILVVDDESDVEVLFRQQFRRDLRAGRFLMEFAQSAGMALQRISDAGDELLILILSDINMPGMSGLELLPKAKALRPDVPVIMITAYGGVDVAVAVSLTMSVTNPYYAALGGGGFALVKMTGPVEALDFRETAPAAAAPCCRTVD